MSRVLLVDDEDCILRTTAVLLESEGHSTVCVLNGREALSLLKSTDFDLMITDIRMTPMDGMQLIREARQIRAGLPVIVISAYGSEKTVEDARAMGACAYIKKPFTIAAILGAIRDAIKPAGGQDA